MKLIDYIRIVVFLILIIMGIYLNCSEEEGVRLVGVFCVMFSLYPLTSIGRESDYE